MVRGLCYNGDRGENAMSMQSPTDAEAFYDFLGQTLSHGERETPPEALLRKWRAQREYDETVEAIREGLAQMEAGLGRPVEEVFADLRRKYGISDR
jgi:predicted transcriptional regulator